MARFGWIDPGSALPGERDEPRPGGIPRGSGRVGPSVRRGPQPAGRGRSRTDSSQRPRRHAHEHRGHVPRHGTITSKPHHSARHDGGTGRVLGDACDRDPSARWNHHRGRPCRARSGNVRQPDDPCPLRHWSGRRAPGARHHARRRSARGRIESRRPPVALRRPPDSAGCRAESLPGPCDVPLFGSGPDRARRPAPVRRRPVRRRTGHRARVAPCSEWLQDSWHLDHAAGYVWLPATRATHPEFISPTSPTRRPRMHARRRDRGKANRAERTGGCNHRWVGALARTGQSRPTTATRLRHGLALPSPRSITPSAPAQWAPIQLWVR